MLGTSPRDAQGWHQTGSTGNTMTPDPRTSAFSAFLELVSCNAGLGASWGVLKAGDMFCREPALLSSACASATENLLCHLHQRSLDTVVLSLDLSTFPGPWHIPGEHGMLLGHSTLPGTTAWHSTWQCTAGRAAQEPCLGLGLTEEQPLLQRNLGERINSIRVRPKVLWFRDSLALPDGHSKPLSRQHILIVLQLSLSSPELQEEEGARTERVCRPAQKEQQSQISSTALVRKAETKGKCCERTLKL